MQSGPTHTCWYRRSPSLQGLQQASPHAHRHGAVPARLKRQRSRRQRSSRQNQLKLPAGANGATRLRKAGSRPKPAGAMLLPHIQSTFLVIRPGHTNKQDEVFLGNYSLEAHQCLHHMDTAPRPSPHLRGGSQVRSLSRPAFCARVFCHQAGGGLLSGLRLSSAFSIAKAASPIAQRGAATLCD